VRSPAKRGIACPRSRAVTQSTRRRGFRRLPRRPAGNMRKEAVRCERVSNERGNLSLRAGLPAMTILFPLRPQRRWLRIRVGREQFLLRSTCTASRGLRLRFTSHAQPCHYTTILLRNHRISTTSTSDTLHYIAMSLRRRVVLCKNNVWKQGLRSASKAKSFLAQKLLSPAVSTSPWQWDEMRTVSSA